MDPIINDILVTALLAWLIAQVSKVVINATFYKIYDVKRLWGDGGMPSAHSATVSSMACITLLQHGIYSALFGICCVVAIIVCHDALGVRKETEKQAILLNEIREKSEIELSERAKKIILKEHVGHSAIEVIAGILLGIAVACCVNCIYDIF